MSCKPIVGLILTTLFTISAGQWDVVLDHRMLFPRDNVVPGPSRAVLMIMDQPVPIRLTPFPDCLSNPLVSTLFSPETLKDLFNQKLAEEEAKLVPSTRMNTEFDNGDILLFHEAQLRSDSLNGPLLARVSTRIVEEILARLSCATNAATTGDLMTLLNETRTPSRLCAFRPDANCAGSVTYRTISGVCNNLAHPYQGSARTAFGRLIHAAYDDGIRTPRSTSALGGPLPGCRETSLGIDSKPFFDTSINHHWVIYGQFIVHDLTMSVPVTESGRTARVPCSCDSQDTDMCNIVRFPPDDPVMVGQRCINMSATAQVFSNQFCSLGVKEQMNGNSHYIDLSPTYGSINQVSMNLRTQIDGLMKVVHTPWSKFELPPGEMESRSCVDGAASHRCFGGGDSRIMENLVLSGIQSQWLRAHNRFSLDLRRLRPDWKGADELLYQESRKILVALHQNYIYNLWLPILIGEEAAARYVGDRGRLSRYDPETPAVVLNEIVAGVFRLHTFVRDSVTRCRPNGDFIDQLLLNDVTTKAKIAYDAPNNGVDAILCGSLHDYGYAGDRHYADQLHHHLFERVTRNGEIRRNDVVAINICRGREHGIPGYNAYREFCGLPRARGFEDFGDVMSVDSIQSLQGIYSHPDDVDLLIGANHENAVPGGVVGPVSVCLFGIQFRQLKYGDRFFFTHEGQFTPAQLQSIMKYPFACFFCHVTDIDRVPQNPFRPPSPSNNPTTSCDQCPRFDFTPWGM